MSHRVSAVVLAAGKGTRVGAGKNKIFMEIASRPLLLYALSSFMRSPLVDEIVLVIAPGEEGIASALVEGMEKKIRITRGGKKRQDSSLAGVSAASGKIVLIHDGARPFPTADLIERVIDGVAVHGACVPVLPMADTLRYGRIRDYLRSASIDRTDLLRVQTPQGFKRDLIEQALAEATDEFTDDASAALACEIPVWAVSGEEMNIKVTTKEDLLLAEMIAAARV